jgi:hypothetical protein
MLRASSLMSKQPHNEKVIFDMNQERGTHPQRPNLILLRGIQLTYFQLGKWCYHIKFLIK